jgi:ubiquinone/menaquinone biosynthesis C-methylase UbiE
MSKTIKTLGHQSNSLAISRNDIDYFDRMASTFDSDPVKIRRAKHFAEAILREIEIKPNFTGLDYGCGTGLASFFLQPFLKKITLADHSSGMLAVLSQKIKDGFIENMVPIKLDIVQDPLPVERFNLVFSLMTMHHILDTELVMKKFCSLLKSPGYLCIGDLDQEEGAFHDRDFSRHNGFDRDSLANIAKTMGFKNIRFLDFFNMEKKINDNEMRHFSLFLMAAEKS